MLPWLAKSSSAQSFSQLGAVSVGYHDCVLDDWFKKKKTCLIGVFFQAAFCYTAAK